MSSKAKKHPGKLQSDIHAITPLSLDAVAQRLLSLQTAQIRVGVRRIDEDVIIWQMAHIPAGKARSNAVVRGRIIRWQGTETRVDAEGETVIRTEWLNSLVQLLIVALVAPILLVASVTLLQQNLALFPFVLFLVSMGYMGWRMLLNLDIRREARMTALRDLDAMFQHIADVLVQDIDQALTHVAVEEPDQLSELLKREVSEHPISMDDGELS